MIIKPKCSTCGGPAESIAEQDYPGFKIFIWKCGHAESVKKLSTVDFADFISLDGKKPYKFQIEGAVFGSQTANGRVLIMDEMGLGKTVQAYMILWAHAKEMRRFLLCCKRKLRMQMRQELTRWCGEDWAAQIIEGEYEDIVPGMAGGIISFDTLWRFKDIQGYIKRNRIKTLILDEVQHFKNTGAKRTQGVQLAARECKYILALSGTPIANHAGEFFPILNMLRPDLYPTKTVFEQRDVDTYWNGRSLKYGGLKNPAAFKQKTKDFIIRRTRAEVLPDLPAISREFRFTELGEKVEELYKATFKEFQNYWNYGSVGASARDKQANVLAYLSKMRHITGIAKIEPALDYLEDFVTDTDRKIVVFTHHVDVQKKLYELLQEEQKKDPDKWGGPILTLRTDDVYGTVCAFRDTNSRILLASMIADAEGLNLQFCSDMIGLEHEWTPIKEAQAEARFPRPGQTADKIFATYMVAVGTVDEYLVRLKEKKRAAIEQAVDGKTATWDESAVIMELAEILAMTGGKQWGW